MALPEERFLAVPSSMVDQRLPGSAGMDDVNEAEDTSYDSTHGVDASTLPQDVRVGHEEPEEDALVSDNDALRIAKAKAWDATRLLVNGSFDVNADNPQNLCVLCGSPEHGFRAWGTRRHRIVEYTNLWFLATPYNPKKRGS